MLENEKKKVREKGILIRNKIRKKNLMKFSEK